MGTCKSELIRSDASVNFCAFSVFSILQIIKSFAPYLFFLAEAEKSRQIKPR